MHRWNLPPWVSLALAVAAPVAAGTWWVRDKQEEVRTEQREMRTATMQRLDALYYEVCALRQAVASTGLSRVCGADGRPDLAPVVSRYYARLPADPISPLLLAYLGIGACTVGSVCLLLFARRFGDWADRRQLEERVASLERWRSAECPDKLPPDEEVDCA